MSSRRRFLRRLAATATAGLLAGWLGAAARPRAADAVAPHGALIQRYRIAVCDWMILELQRLGAFPLAKEIGADGVEVEMGGLGDSLIFDSRLVDPVVRRPFLDFCQYSPTRPRCLC